ncbi:MAG: YdcF family protein [Atopobiaceae bacterium]|nr:YdcF family protein [Atopobiaceae bacterium]
MGELDVLRVAAAANTIAAWLGCRDVSELSCAALRDEAGLADGCADWFVLFGGGVIGSADALAEAMRTGVAHRYAIVGGRGHATYWLDESMKSELEHWDDDICPPPVPGEASEAEMLATILAQRHGLTPDLLETRSTNCGNNITYLMDLLEGGEAPTSIILSQDAAMQRRMGATWARQAADRPRYLGTRVVEWATWRAELSLADGQLGYVRCPRGMWPLDTYLGLLMGDVERLADDEGGYGPRGRDFLVHVDVPQQVQAAYTELRGLLGSGGRPSDERYAS